MTEREIIEKFDNLSEDELNAKVIKKFMSKMMLWQLLLNVAGVKKKRGERKIVGFRKKLMIPESEISECPELEVKSKIGNTFMNEKILEEHSVTVYKILIFMILIFKSIRKKK